MKTRASGIDFFDRQERAQRRTWRLLTLFLLVFVFLTGGTYLVMGLVLDLVLAIYAEVEPQFFIPFLNGEFAQTFHWGLASVAVGSTGLIVGGGTLHRIKGLREGGAALAGSVGAKEVFYSDSDWRVRRYINIVEEMALASGVPMPRTFILPQQEGINGFAAGFSVNDATVAVTEGALKYLDRDELQALVAHEFSHILNGDMQLNVWLVGLLSGVLGIYMLGESILEMARSLMAVRGGQNYFGMRAAMAGISYGVLLLIPGWLVKMVGLGGLVGSRLIKAGVSREREFLADAAAVQFTRNPEALVRALKKIGGAPEGAQLRGAGLEAISHMCFGEASSAGLTHPSLETRILALDPSFNADLGFAVLGPQDEQLASGEEKPRRPVVRPPQRGDSLGEFLSQIGEVSADELAYSAVLLERLPEPIEQARLSVAGAIAIAYLLLINGEGPHKKEQARIIEFKSGQAVAGEAQRLWPVVRGLDDELRLPLLDLLFATLRQMTREQFERFKAVAKELIEVDGEVSFQEFVLERLLLGRLEDAMDPGARKGVQLHSFSGVRRDLEHILSAMAYAGSDYHEEVAYAFELGRDQIPAPVGPELELRDRSLWDFETIAVALERLASSSVAIRVAAIEACAYSVMADGKVEVAEAELLRAFCSLLGVPVPPIVRV